MAKAAPFLIDVDPGLPDGLEFAAQIRDTLKEEHGVHGARLIGQSVLLGGDVPTIPSVQLRGGEDNAYLLAYEAPDGTPKQLTTSRAELLRTLSTFVVDKLRLEPTTQSSRADREDLAGYAGTHPRLDQDPSTWITGNPLMSELCRRYPQYGNLVRYLCNERGLFLKVGNFPAERAYWNSTTNGGLPIVKKADPIHEGTFKLHDLFHFVPTDPILGDGPIGEQEKATYLAHRMMSEASTLVLADMIAVADANLEARGYDITKRQIFPVFQSIVEAQGGNPGIDKLLAANVYFCFTGDTKGFELLGASPESLEAYRAKYESIFRDDFMWNLQNLENMIEEAKANPAIADYQAWLQSVGFPSLADYDRRVVTPEGVNIADMLSNFRASFKSALSYSEPIDDLRREKLATRKYLAGQRIVFARYGGMLDASDSTAAFDAWFNALSSTADVRELRRLSAGALDVTDRYLENLYQAGHLLPHQFEANRFAAPLYPVKFINYERARAGSEQALSAHINSFTQANSTALRRLLEIVES